MTEHGRAEDEIGIDSAGPAEAAAPEKYERGKRGRAAAGSGNSEIQKSGNLKIWKF